MTSYRIEYRYFGSVEIEASSYQEASRIADRAEVSIYTGKDGEIELSLIETDIEPQES